MYNPITEYNSEKTGYKVYKRKNMDHTAYFLSIKFLFVKVRWPWKGPFVFKVFTTHCIKNTLCVWSAYAHSSGLQTSITLTYAYAPSSLLQTSIVLSTRQSWWHQRLYFPPHSPSPTFRPSLLVQAWSRNENKIYLGPYGCDVICHERVSSSCTGDPRLSLNQDWV